ncbi:MAG TPA: 16S rRNA (guanine(966)-N(2))-methyltransferase RsmD [Polyangiaceae bacterium]
MRITGGTLRSRTLRAPPGSATRPTTDRVREALFGILASVGALEGANVADLYAGTGALGIEAISRGARRATLVESARPALAALRANVESLGVNDRVRVVPGDVGASARRIASDGPFDLVLADPPWADVDSGDAARALASLAAAGAFASAATLVLEHASRSQPPEIVGLAREDTRRYGDTALTFYKIAILAEPPGRSHDRGPLRE